MRQANEGEEGMMLVEALVGLAILSLVSLSMFRAFAGTAQAIGAVQEARMRLVIAEDVSARAMQDDAPAPRVLTGLSDGRQWRVEIAPVAAAAAPGRPAAFTVRTFVGDPSSPPLLTSVVIGAAP